MSNLKRKQISWQVRLDTVLRISKQTNKISRPRRRKKIVPLQEIGLRSKKHRELILRALMAQKFYDHRNRKQIDLVFSPSLSLKKYNYCFYNTRFHSFREKQLFGKVSRSNLDSLSSKLVFRRKTSRNKKIRQLQAYM